MCACVAACNSGRIAKNHQMKEGFAMYCVHNGIPSVMVYDTVKGEYVYIPERKWDRLNKDQKKQFRISHLHEETPFERAKINA